MGVTPQEAAISAMVKVLTFVHALRLAGQLGCHLGLAATGAATGPGGGQAGHRPLLDEGRLVLGHQREDAEDELAVRGGGVDDPVGQQLHPDVAGRQRGDDLDQVAEVAAEPVDLPDDEGVAGP